LLEQLGDSVNIITDRWIPVRRQSGALDNIRPADIADRHDPAVALMWPRPDFNLACLELLIGLVYAAMPPEEDDDYIDQIDDDLHKELVERLDSFSVWFTLGGNGPRFMQSLESLSGNVSGVDMLLLDSAGDQTAKNNADMMVRRDRYDRLGSAAAAIALYTFQNFAPAGGAGNRTSMRGGGPLVTLVEPCADATLWEIAYANTPPGQPVDQDQAHLAFPWLAETVNSKLKGSEVHSPQRDDDSTPWSAFFGMPRQLRLEFDQSPGYCSMTGMKDELMISGVIQKPYGNNYGVWRHPSSPYYRIKAGEEALPVHPKPGRLGYRQFIGISIQDPQNKLRYLAECVTRFKNKRFDSEQSHIRLIVGGWAMDNMKPVDFIEGFAPLPVNANATLIEETASRLVKAADVVAGHLVVCLKRALLIDASDKGLVANAKAEFYDNTEEGFHTALSELLFNPEDATVGEQWLKTLEEHAIKLFDSNALEGFSDRKPERAQDIADARKSLKFTLLGYGKNGVALYSQLRLQAPEPKKRKQATEISHDR